MRIQHINDALRRGRLRSLLIGLLMAAYVGGVALLQPRSATNAESLTLRDRDITCALTLTQVFDQIIATSRRCDRGSSEASAR